MSNVVTKKLTLGSSKYLKKKYLLSSFFLSMKFFSTKYLLKAYSLPMFPTELDVADSESFFVAHIFSIPIIYTC